MPVGLWCAGHESRRGPTWSVSRTWSIMVGALLHTCFFVCSGLAQSIEWGISPQRAIELLGEPKSYYPGEQGVIFYDVSSGAVTILFEQQKLSEIIVSMDVSSRLATITVTPDTLPVLAQATGLLGAFLRGEGNQAYDLYIAEFYSTFSQPRFILAFASMPWGSSRTDVLRQRGDPIRESVLSDTLGITGMLYRDSVLGQDVFVFFTVQVDEGLVSGTYYVDYETDIECQIRFREFRDAIGQRYEDIEFHEYKSRQAGLDVCADGEVWTVSWDDPASEARIEMRVKHDIPAIEVHYMGPSWFAWLKRMRDVELGRKL